MFMKSVSNKQEVHVLIELRNNIIEKVMFKNTSVSERIKPIHL